MAIIRQEQPSWGQILGGAAGQGIGGALAELAQQKMQEIQVRKLGDRFEKLGLPRDLAGAPTHIQTPYIKEHMRKQALSNIPQFDWNSLGSQGGLQQQGQQGGMLGQLGGQPNPEETPWLAQQAQQMGGMQPQQPMNTQGQANAPAQITKLLQQANLADQASPGAGKQFRDAAHYLEGQQKIAQKNDLAAASEIGKNVRLEKNIESRENMNERKLGQQRTIQQDQFFKDLNKESLETEKNARENINSLKTLRSLAQTNKIRSGSAFQLADKVGLGDFLANEPTQLFNKVAADLGTKMLSHIANPTDAKLAQINRGLVNARQSAKGIEYITSYQILENKKGITEAKERRNLYNKYRSSGKELPADIDAQAYDLAKKKIKEIDAKQASLVDKLAGTAIKDKERFERLQDIDLNLLGDEYEVVDLSTGKVVR